jgi:hypothetical protein
MRDFHPENIPTELRERRQWVCWRFAEREGKQTKVPIDPATGDFAAADNPATWGTFDAARARAHRDKALAGIGFMFTATDPYCGVDLDHVRDPATGQTAPQAAADIAALATYTEESQSGTGYHLICRAQLPGHKGRRKEPVELYDARRFFVMTGRRHPEAPATIEDRQAQVDALLSRLFPTPPAPPPGPATATPTGAPPPQSDPSDAALLAKARAARNGRNFAALYDRGEWEGNGYPSHSEADAALCAMLAYWTHNDAARIDRLFRQSGLMRDKWERPDYRAATIEKAMQRGDTAAPPAPSRTIYPTADECAPPRAADAGRVTQDGPLVEFFTPSQLRNARIAPGTNMVGEYHIQRGAPFIIAGAPCVGKSLAATALAVAGATAAPWFGLPVHGRFKTMILQAENGLVRLRNEYNAITADADLDEYIRVCTPPPRGFAFNDPAFVDQLTAAILAFRPDLFLLDPWNRHAADDKGKDYRPAHGIVAHTRKPRTDERANGRALMNLIAGSYQLVSIARAAFVMQAASDDPADTRVVWTCCKNNDGPMGKPSAWERGNGLFTPVNDIDWHAFEGRADPRATITEEDLDELFDGGKRSLTLKEAVKALMEQTAFSQPACYKALDPTKGRFAHRLNRDGKALSWKV